MLRHVVMFRWRDGTTPEHLKAIEEGLGGLPAAIPELRAYTFGGDIGVNEGNFDFAVVADFHDADDYVAYRDHPLHQAVLAERIRDHVADRAAVQFNAA
jgi:hypothetical protein